MVETRWIAIRFEGYQHSQKACQNPLEKELGAILPDFPSIYLSPV